MSMLDIIAEYNRRVEEEKKLLDERIFREKVISNLEEKLNFKIEYPGVESTEKEMKKGSRVRIRRDSEYAEENNGIGTMQGDFGSVVRYEIEKWANVRFDNSGVNPYRKKDLKPAEKYTKEEIKQIKEKNKEKTNEFYKQPFNLFKGYLKQQVEEINSKEFKVGNKIRLNEGANRYGVTKEGSEGEITNIRMNREFDVKFIKIKGDGKEKIYTESFPTFPINKKYMEHLIPKEDPEKLVQESINHVKKEFKV